MEEIWKDIKDHEGYYQISNFGRVKSLNRIVNNRLYESKILKPTDNKGYQMIRLSRYPKQYSFLIHRLVAAHFIENPNNLPDVNHIDCNKSNNHVDNLEWTTEKKNINHAILNGRMNHIYGSNNHKSIFTQEIVNKLRKEYIENEEITQVAQLAKKYNYPKIAVQKILNNKNWFDPNYQKIVESAEFIKKLSSATKGEGNSQAKLTEEDVKTIRKLSSEGVTNQELSNLFPVTKYTIQQIVTFQRWKHV